jgi:CBS domain-containing protein
LLRRENIGTTFLGHNLALPHGYLDSINDVYILFIRLEKEMTVTYDYKQSRIKYIFAVLTSTKKAPIYLKVLSSIAHLVTINSYVLDNAKSARDLIETLDSKEFLVDQALTAKDLISSHVNIKGQETVAAAVDCMKKNRITFLPVVNKDGILEGIVDLADIFAATFKSEGITPEDVSIINDFKSANDLFVEPIQHFWENENRHLINEIMRKPDTFTVQQNSNYADVVFMMTKYHHRYLIVIDDTNKVHGIVDTDDIVHKMIRV